MIIDEYNFQMHHYLCGLFVYVRMARSREGYIDHRDTFEVRESEILHSKNSILFVHFVSI